jgi:hypothetical protein
MYVFQNGLDSEGRLTQSAGRKLWFITPDSHSAILCYVVPRASVYLSMRILSRTATLYLVWLIKMLCFGLYAAERMLKLNQFHSSVMLVLSLV